MVGSLLSVVVLLGQAQVQPKNDPTPTIVVRGPFRSVQVNVDTSGRNVVGDAANEPSLAIHPKDRRRIVVGWRQFDSITSNFVQAGWSHSDDGGKSWKAAGTMDRGQYRTQPHLGVDAEGVFYFVSRSTGGSTELFRSRDGGGSWEGAVPLTDGVNCSFAMSSSKNPWRTDIYAACDDSLYWSPDKGDTLSRRLDLPVWLTGSTTTVSVDGVPYVAGWNDGRVTVLRTNGEPQKRMPVVLSRVGSADLGGTPRNGAGPNPGGALGRLQLQDGDSGKSLYLLCSVDPPGPDPLDVMFTRSNDGGATWSKPLRVNDDPAGTPAWQWFAAMSVAPNGRIDVIWNDTRSDRRAGRPSFSELYYAFSKDGGRTWSPGVPVSPRFNHHVGYPNQNRLGNGYDMISDDQGASVVYAATFNKEQDVYFLRIPRAR